MMITLGGYLMAVSDLGDRRAAQKARTRERIRTTAQALFAEHGFEAVTLVHVAAEARVSVQTVFNHYSSKEELFFAERTQWVEGPAQAVRSRSAGESPTAALRAHFVAMVADYARSAGGSGHRALVGVLAGSPSLLAYERSLHEDAVARLGVALADAWGCGAGAALRAQVTASIWLAAVRAVLLDLRGAPPAPGDDAAVRAAADLVDGVLGDLEACPSFSGGGARLVA